LESPLFASTGAASVGKWMISNGGGVEPRWSRDGRELFSFCGQTLMAVPVSVQPTFSYGEPVALFDAPIQARYTSDSRPCSSSALHAQ
jgi:hypothetical protein